MLSLKLIRENPSLLEKCLRDRQQETAPAETLVMLDKEWRRLKAESDRLKSEKNRESLAIAEAKKKGQDVSAILARTKELAQRIALLDEKASSIETQMEDILLTVPNIPHHSVPVGMDETGNREVRRWGEPKKKSADVKPHYEVAEGRLIDFERGSKVAGHRFVFLKGLAARLERSLISFMMDLHAMNGYTEVIPPYFVNSKAMRGTGQLPKFAVELYKCAEDDLWAIPTAEVPVTNLFAEETLEESQLPMRFCAYSACFRREAGSYQKDIKGIMRQHQFNKVELLHFSLPENSYEELERMTREAELVLQKLGLPYRVVELCTADLGFASAKTYDLEVWVPSQDRYREISSCSNCTDFQARRAGIKFRRGGKTEFVHTLNGSGIAVGRTMIAIMENFQDERGFAVPKALQDYMKTDYVEF
ncbi:MAG: serine--tRNA ligase [Candidatus Micrarchaeota archaeon]|nr:serine--tRNA ligase [Candidatus Micrarchaeota archaeon]